MKKIVFFIQNFSRSGGSERVTSIIAGGLCAAGYDVSILSVCGDNTSFYELDRRIKLFTLINRPEVDNKKLFPKVMSSLRRFYSEYRPDLVIDVFAALSIYTLLLKPLFGFKNVTWEHYNYKNNTGMNRIGRKLSVRYSDMIVTLTRTDRQYYLDDNKPKCPVLSISNPSPYQDAVSLEERKKQVILVGRLAPVKAFERAVYVWSLIEPETDWEMLLFGEGEERPKLESLIKRKKLKRFRLMGAVRDIGKQYEQAGIMLSTSRFEGLPMAMIEAQSFGVPIVSYTYETGPKEIIANGRSGILIPKGTEKEMIRNCANELLALINDESRRRSMQFAAKKSSERFKNDRIIQKWLNALNRLGI